MNQRTSFWMCVAIVKRAEGLRIAAGQVGPVPTLHHVKSELSYGR